jgi:ribonucleoside-diphosphate reductase alpha chain
LPNRRSALTFNFVCSAQHYTATVGYFPGTNQLAEIFLGNGRAGSDLDAAAKDSAVVASLALQFGTPVDVIRRALLRDPRGGDAVGDIGDFKKRVRAPSYLSPEEIYFDSIVHALRKMPRHSRLGAIAAACDDADLKDLARFAAYSLGSNVLPEIKRVLDCIVRRS